MGCFSAQQQRRVKKRTPLSSYLASPQTTVVAETLEHESFYSSPTSSCHNSRRSSCELAGSHVSLPKTASPLHSSSFQLMKIHLKPSPTASPLRVSLFPHNRENVYPGENGALQRSSSYGHGGSRLAISHSAPNSAFPLTNEQSSSNTSLFPLPAPPPTASVVCALPSMVSTDDAFSRSVSSTGSGSSLSSLAPFSSCSTSGADSSNSKSYNKVSSCSLSASESSTPRRMHLPALPLPPPPDSAVKLREFSYEELAGACLNFAKEAFIREGSAGPVFRAALKHAVGENGSVEVSVTRLFGTRVHSFKKWRMEVVSLARLSHPHLCKVLGCTGEDPVTPPDKRTGYERERLLVYEHTSNGSLDSLLYCRSGKPPLDWATRVKIAMGAAKGLAYLHERVSRQVIYKSFRTINVQIDKGFNAKLSDYGFARSCGNLPMSSPAHFRSVDDAYMAPETRMLDELSTKSNVWSFGIVLLELLTGRQHMDDFFLPEERNLLQWCRPYVLDSKRLYLIMDPELKGRYPTRLAKVLADLALLCLAEDPEGRPSMRDVAKSICIHVFPDDAGADLKAVDDAFNVGAKIQVNAISRINSANFTMNYPSLGKSSCDGSVYNNNGSKFKLSKSYNLASILASPARAFGGSARATENADMLQHVNCHKTRLKGFLSAEISKGASRSMPKDHPCLSSYGFLYGEVGLRDSELTKMAVCQDYYHSPLF